MRTGAQGPRGPRLRQRRGLLGVNSATAMSAAPASAFAAQLLERGATGYAGFAAAALLERNPAVRELFGPDSLGSWKTHLVQRLLELAAALSAAEPRIFVARVLWTDKAFRARQQDDRLVRQSLESLREVLTERLPEPARAAPVEYIDQALAALSQPAAVAEPAALDPARPTDRLALQYLEKALDGDVAGAVGQVLEATRNGLELRSAYVDVLLAAQREIGRLWHLAQVSTAEEHMVSFTTQRAMAVLSSSAGPVPANGRTAIVAAVATNAHDIGLRAVADLYHLAGWKSIFLGADVPMDDLPGVINYFQADLLLLGATLSTQLPRVQQTIAAVRERAQQPVKVVVGGAAFDEAADVWQKVGADAYAARIDEAVSLGARLVGA